MIVESCRSCGFRHRERASFCATCAWQEFASRDIPPEAGAGPAGGWIRDALVSVGRLLAAARGWLPSLSGPDSTAQDARLAPRPPWPPWPPAVSSSLEHPAQLIRPARYLELAAGRANLPANHRLGRLDGSGHTVAVLAPARPGLSSRPDQIPGDRLQVKADRRLASFRVQVIAQQYNSGPHFTSFGPLNVLARVSAAVAETGIWTGQLPPRSA